MLYSSKYICHIRPCQIGIVLSVNSSLTNLGTYSQKHTNRKRQHLFYYKNNALYIYLIEKTSS